MWYWFGAGYTPSMTTYPRTNTGLGAIALAATATAIYLLWGQTIATWLGDFLAGLTRFAPL